MQEAISTALKEWSSVVEALKSGRQVMLIRKGGLADRGKVFAVEETEFFLYPSFLHQQVEFVRPELVGDFRDAITPKAPDGKVVLDCYAVVEDAIPVASREELLGLDGLHVWNHRFIEHRLQWKPESPAWVVLLRVYRLSAPVVLEEHRLYKGCRSWVRLQEEVPTLGAIPVLADARFAEEVGAVRAALAGAIHAR